MNEPYRVSIASACDFVGFSRQAYYQASQAAREQAEKEAMIISVVKEIRHELPYCGTRKLHADLKGAGIDIGRDQLFNLLRKNDLLVKRKKNYMRTTNSRHRFEKYSNLIKDIVTTRVNEVFVSDITYIRTREGFCYLALVTDVHTRKIVGYDLSQSLAFEGAQRALKMALSGVHKSDNLIHHSDRGIQYCSHAYTDMLKAKGCRISMTEENHCYENAIAERINGILKHEFSLGDTLQSFKVAKELVTQAVWLYNNKRRHLSLDFLTPQEVYKQSMVRIKNNIHFQSELKVKKTKG